MSINDHEKADIITLLKKQYSFIASMKPDARSASIGEQFSTLAKSAVNMGSEHEIYVSMGYNSTDISVSLKRLRQYPDLDILFMNLMGIEFTADFLMFARNRDEDHLKYLFSKYMRNVELANGNIDTAGMYNWMFSRYDGRNDFSYLKYLALASVAEIFVLLHEWTHAQKDFKTIIIDLLKSPPTNKLLINDDDKYIEEIACDYSSLSLITEFNLVEKPFQCSKNELVEVALLRIFTIELYPLFSKLLMTRKGSWNQCSEDILANIMGLLQKRFKDLNAVIKISKNSNMFFPKELDIMGAIDSVGGIINDYILQLGNFLENMLPYEIDCYESLPLEEKQRYMRNVNKEEIWSIFL